MCRRPSTQCEPPTLRPNELWRLRAGRRSRASRGGVGFGWVTFGSWVRRGREYRRGPRHRRAGVAAEAPVGVDGHHASHLRFSLLVARERQEAQPSGFEAGAQIRRPLPETQILRHVHEVVSSLDRTFPPRSRARAIGSPSALDRAFAPSTPTPGRCHQRPMTAAAVPRSTNPPGRHVTLWEPPPIPGPRVHPERWQPGQRDR
jgi:hypothetical protein